MGKVKKGINSIDKDIENTEKLLCCKAVTHKNYEEFLRWGWTIFLGQESAEFSTLDEERKLMEAFFQTGQVPESFELLYTSTEREGSSNQRVRSSASTTVLQVRAYTNNCNQNDPECAPINDLIQILGKLPEKFGTQEEISIIERINHPSLNSEEQIYNKKDGVSKTLTTFLTNLLDTYQELGPYCCRLAATLKVIYCVQWNQEFESENGGIDDSCPEDDDRVIKEEKMENSIKFLVECTITALFQFIDKLEKMMKAQSDARDSSSKLDTSNEAWRIRNCVSNKIKQLWSILMAKKVAENAPPDDPDQLCGIIFCKRRLTAQVVRWYLDAAAKHWPNELGFIKPEVMMGQSTVIGDVELARFTAQRQSKILEQFHKRELNLLVATQVVEEGLNVPACNLVLRLDSIASYPSFIQSFGRARKRGAICYALIDQRDEINERKKIKSFAEYNEKLALALQNNALHVEDDDEIEIGQFHTPIPPFIPSGNPNGPMITDMDAISLVHRYCNLLSCDKIAALVPTAWNEEGIEEDERKVFKARVLLPFMSPVRHVVEGDWMPNKRLAKRSAYLKSCVELYKEGEFTENLLPKARSIESFKCEFLDKLDMLKKEETKNVPGKIGTKKRRQWYPKQIPAVFDSMHPENVCVTLEPDVPLSVYKINIKLAKFVGNPSFRGLYNFERYELCYGIVTSQSASLPKFTLNANYGTLEVSIDRCLVTQKSLSKVEIEALESFQVYLRDAIFDIRSSVLSPDSQRSILIAPLDRVTDTDNTYEIDWKLVGGILNVHKKEHFSSQPSQESRKEMQFDPKLYENAVLVPWYKNEEPSELCALSVTKMNAVSDFDGVKKSKKYKTFEEHYKEEYNVQLFHPEFPLIHCKRIAKQLNFLIKKVDSYETNEKGDGATLGEHVIPELINIHILPASLYVQGKFLPSILHRIYRLLLANELRLKVARYFEWDVDNSGNDNMVILNVDDGGDKPAAKENLKVENEESNNDNGTYVEKKEEREKRTQNFFLLDAVNPSTVDWKMIMNSAKCPERKRKPVRDGEFCMPEPPVCKSVACEDLINIETVECYDFDKETNFMTETGPSMETLMEALTLSNAQDNINLEKLEVMGDSVLKLVASLHVFRSFPRWDEGKMTLMRMKLISNCHFYQLGKEHNLGELLSGSFFIPDKSWLPVGFKVSKSLQAFVLSEGLDYADLKTVPELVMQNMQLLEAHLAELRALTGKEQRHDNKVPHTTFTHSHIGDKSVADCVEAIIGAYYVSGGIDAAFRIMEYLGMRGPLENGSVTRYSRESTMSPITQDSVLPKTQSIVPLLGSLEETICYKFKNPWVAVEALSHPSYMGNRITPSYERLEFVGDAILDFLITNYILKKTNITDPGDITDLRAALVNNVTFASLAVKYGFQTYLKYDSRQLKQFINQFAQYQEENDYKITDPCKLVSDFECPTVQEIDVPKVLGDVFESIAGAVFVDSGMSIDAVWKVFYRLMKKEMEAFSKNIPKAPLRELYELFPGTVKFYPASPNSKYHSSQSKYQTVFLKISDSKSVTPVIGIGTTIKQAKQAAAKYVVRKKKWPDAGK